MRLNRKVKSLNDAIEALDQRLVEAKHKLGPKSSLEEQIAQAWNFLSPVELEFVADELSQCVSSRVYYLENYHTIATEQGQITCMNPLFDLQWLVENAIQKERDATGQSKVIVDKPRQAGVTEYAVGVMCNCSFFTPNAYTISVAQAPDVAAHVQRKVNIAHQGLPWWMRPEVLYRTKGEYMEFNRKDVSERFSNPGLGSVFVTTHSQRDSGIAIGRTVRNLHMCLTENNFVIDREGYHKSISNVLVGDWVRIPNGNAKVLTVSDKFASSIYNGAENGYKITPWCGSAFPVEGTGNHKIMCAELKFSWDVEKRRKKPGDSIRNATLVKRGMKDLSEISPKDKLVYPVRMIQDLPVDPSVFSEKFVKGAAGPSSAWTPPAPSKEFGFAIGLYLAEGCISDTRRCIAICLDSDEQDMADRFSKALGMNYGKPVRSKTSRTVAYNYYSSAITAWFKEHFGAKDNKHIPSWAWNYGRAFLTGIVEGLIAGDGHINPKYHYLQFTSTRVQLAVELRDAICSLGFGWSAICYKEAGFLYGRNCQGRYDVIVGRLGNALLRKEFGWSIALQDSAYEHAKSHWTYSSDKSEVYVSIRKIERVLLNKVYDIEVDSSDHEFLLPCAWTHNSEVSRFSSTEIYTQDIEPSMNALDTNGIAESTGFGAEGLFYNMWIEAIEGESDWVPVFLPAYRARKFSLPLTPRQIPFKLTEPEESIRERVKLEEKFIITDEFFNWRRRRIKSSIKRTGFDYAHRESYPVSWRDSFQFSGNKAFPRHKLDYQKEVCERRPLYVGEIIFKGKNAPAKLLMNKMTDADGNYLDIPLEKRERENRLYIWELPKPGEVYYQAVDVGGGNDGDDFSVSEILRAGAGASPDVQVAEWVGWEQPKAFAKIVYALGTYFNRCETAVEYAREGMTTANELVELEYPNLYRPRHRDRIGSQLAAYLHWQTTGKTKPLIKAQMSETLLENGVVIRSQYAIDELAACVKDGSSFCAPSGGHDDSSMALTIALFCLRETMPELHASAESAADGGNTAPSRGARASGGAVVYGIYDQFFRLRTQTSDLAKAEEFCQKNPGWQIKPIKVSKANTSYSVIHQGGGVEQEMLRGGFDSWDITPGVIGQYRESTGREGGLSKSAQEELLEGPRVAARIGAGQLSARITGRGEAGSATSDGGDWANSLMGGGDVGGEL